MNKISSKILKANPVLVVNYNASSNKLVFGSFAKLRDNGFKNHEVAIYKAVNSFLTYILSQ